MLYAPPAYVPRSTAFPTSPVSPDAVQLMTAWIMPGYQGQGLGRVMVQTVAKDLLRRGFKAIEAFGDARWKEPACVLPADHLLAVGFKTVRPHPTLSAAAAGAADDALLEGGRRAGAGPAAGSGTEGAGAAAAVSRHVRRERASPVRDGPFVFHVKQCAVELRRGAYSAMKSSRSRTMAAFGLAPTMVLATSPPW